MALAEWENFLWKSYSPLAQQSRHIRHIISWQYCPTSFLTPKERCYITYLPCQLNNLLTVPSLQEQSRHSPGKEPEMRISRIMTNLYTKCHGLWNETCNLIHYPFASPQSAPPFTSHDMPNEKSIIVSRIKTAYSLPGNGESFNNSAGIMAAMQISIRQPQTR